MNNTGRLRDGFDCAVAQDATFSHLKNERGCGSGCDTPRVSTGLSTLEAHYAGLAGSMQTRVRPLEAPGLLPMFDRQ
jgi:hypothetical protein